MTVGCVISDMKYKFVSINNVVSKGDWNIGTIVHADKYPK